jgi:hypothetical protein
MVVLEGGSLMMNLYDQQYLFITQFLHDGDSEDLQMLDLFFKWMWLVT